MYNKYIIKLATPFPPIAMVFYTGTLHMGVKKRVVGHVQGMVERESCLQNKLMVLMCDIPVVFLTIVRSYV